MSFTLITDNNSLLATLLLYIKFNLNITTFYIKIEIFSFFLYHIFKYLLIIKILLHLRVNLFINIIFLRPSIVVSACFKYYLRSQSKATIVNYGIFSVVNHVSWVLLSCAFAHINHSFMIITYFLNPCLRVVVSKYLWIKGLWH